ncbi:MAG: acyl-CoA dehydrogenase family protein [Minicystis sp.]
MQALALLLTATAEVAPIASIAAWWERHRALAARGHAPIDLALLGGFGADRLGYAFSSGYQAALRALVPDLPSDRLVSLCVTERGGASPKAITTTLTPRAEGGHRLDGAKRWTTLAAEGGLFLVAARQGEDAQGRPRLRVARVGSSASGVHVDAMPETPFVPEIPHAELRFEGVAVREEDLLPGDGYERYVRPFRTVEDVHVNAALLGYLMGEARRNGLDRALIERLAAAVVALRGLSAGDPSAPALHVTLGGLLRTQSALVEEIDAAWGAKVSPTHARWQRDRVLLQVAENARTQRLARAWERIAALQQVSLGQSAGQGSGGSAGS